MSRLKSLAYKIGYPIMKAYWFFRRPTTEGVRCLIINGNKILLIKHTYGSTLRTTVGGGIKRGETYEQAVLREVWEETGIELTKVRNVGKIEHNKEFKLDTIHVFVSETDKTTIDMSDAEIKEAGWFSLDNLPDDISPLFKQFLRLASI